MNRCLYIVTYLKHRVTFLSTFIRISLCPVSRSPSFCKALCECCVQVHSLVLLNRLFSYRMASKAASKDVGGFKSPTNVRVRNFDCIGGTPVTIPASPFMKKLGCGTGVNVYLMDRLVVPKLFIKRYYTYCSKTLKGPVCNIWKC